jgi:hypothetical protein
MTTTAVHIDPFRTDGSPSLVSPQSEISPTDTKILAVAANALSINSALSIIGLGMQKLELDNNRMNVYIDEATKINQTVQKLLQLNSQLPLSENETTLSDSTIAQFKELEKSQITLLQPGEKKLSPTRLAELKALINSHNDRLKMELQIKFTTQIQVATNEMNSLQEAIKMILKYHDRLMTNIVQRMRSA